MSKQFIFAYARDEITPHTVFFNVAVGDCSRDRRAKAYIDELAQSTDYFWHIRDLETSDFVHNVARSLYPDAVMPLMELRTHAISVTALARAIKDGSLVKVCEAAAATSPQAQRQRAAVDAEYYFRMRSQQPCNPVT